MNRYVVGSVVVVMLSSPAVAEPPDATTVVKEMRAALEPARPSVRQLTILVSAQHGEDARWTAGQVHKQIDGHRQMLTVMLAPKDVHGISFLVQENRGGPPDAYTMHVYLPSLRRTRTLTGGSVYEAFLGTDFTYADLGFEGVPATHKLLDPGTKTGDEFHLLETIPADRWYYQRIVTRVNAKSMLPAERIFYGPDNERWKVETIENVTVIDGVATPLRFVMKDEEAGGQTDITVSSVRYDAEVPDDLFDPSQLRDAVSARVWQGLSR